MTDPAKMEIVRAIVGLVELKRPRESDDNFDLSFAE